MQNNVNNSFQVLYQVSLPVYEGPLDLLLQLIEKNELEITKISLIKVTRPFLEYVKNLQNTKTQELSHFLIVAAKMMQIKSEVLLPRMAERKEGEENLGMELVYQLIQYRKFKEISTILKNRSTIGLQSYLRLANLPTIEKHIELDKIDLKLFVSSASSIFNIPKTENSEQLDIVHLHKVTIQDQIKLITNKLRIASKSNFNNLIKSKSKNEIVITFLALLELVKQFRVSVSQEKLFGDIQLSQDIEWHREKENDVEFGS